MQAHDIKVIPAEVHLAIASDAIHRRAAHFKQIGLACLVGSFLALTFMTDPFLAQAAALALQAVPIWLAWKAERRTAPIKFTS